MVSDKNGGKFCKSYTPKIKNKMKKKPLKPWRIVTLSNIDLNTNFSFDDKVNKTQNRYKINNNKSKKL